VRRRTTSLAFGIPKFKAGRSYVLLQVPTVGPAPPLYDIPESHTLRKVISEADENQKKILHGKPGIERRSVIDFFRLKLGYSSNAIEGNKLSEAEVLEFILYGIFPCWLWFL